MDVEFELVMNLPSDSLLIMIAEKHRWITIQDGNRSYDRSSHDVKVRAWERIIPFATRYALQRGVICLEVIAMEWAPPARKSLARVTLPMAV